MPVIWTSWTHVWRLHSLFLGTGYDSRRGCHAQVGGVSQDVHVDLVASTPELMVRAATVRESPRVAETVEHVPEQGRKAGTVQPVAMKLSVSPEGGVGVVIHLLKTREKQINISSIEHRQQTRNQNKPQRQNVNSDSDSGRWWSRKTLPSETGAESGKFLNTKVIEIF
jgi:hypothetical protein